MENNTTTFESFGLNPEILKAVVEAGFTEPSPVQVEAIPLVLAGNDIVAQAQTGTGKTAAFGLPTLSMLDQHLNKVQLLVITPTRELATQVSDELYSLGRFCGIKTVTIYGGSSYSRQIGLIEKGASVIVATPGRMLDLLKNGRLPGFAPKMVVLDEADEMLDMGFLEDIEEIFTYLPKERQTLLFSATMPDPIKRLASKILHEPKFVSITPKDHTTNEDIEQLYYVINEYERDDAMIRLLDALEPEKSIVFCRTKKEVDRLSTQLMAVGHAAKGLHGDMEQNQRESVIKAFRSSQIEILVATDVAARGLNVADISHVFNYHMPFDPESYVHRIGRTGRAGKKGTAITLVTPIEFHSMQRIGKKVGSKIEHRIVPSLRDVKENKLVKIADDIKNADLNENASKLLSILEEEMDMSQIALKLLSNLLKENTPVGPDKIGLDKKTLESVVKNIEERDGGRGGRSGGYRGNSGGGYRGSRDGGGYRGNSSRDGGGYRGTSSTGSRDGGGYKGANPRDGGSRDARPPRGDGVPRSDSRGESRNPFAKEGSSSTPREGGYKGNRDSGDSRPPRAPRADRPSAPRSDAGRAPKAAPRNAYKKD
ncbi:DEAD/DEAH box helicase [Sulfurospirillum diekertiae]|uniref:DEAD/DEAH box helicase n=1 Tax=Sulfurospirillum diekertiae TaxID=1854492 RepID=A0A6G9VRK4_9BACT|nr:DEAD/DEAH box helicase [Sulfurospirillum diekertiae]QIR75786.1 DEAD/DEAH box helicase [Sulfurospirillum diekertiae]QIR78431.1 DEAD/DEAH box helicase [Sulfurospirillum diekertiae]